MASISLFYRMILSKKSATFWDPAVDAGFRKARISARAGQNLAACWPSLLPMRDLSRIGACSI
jgi:hypothetical protein